MQLKAQIMTKEDMQRALKRMAHEISERNHGCDGVVFFGIKRRGVPLAERLAENLQSIENIDLPVATLDITYYRDDLTEKSADAVVKESETDVDVKDKIVIFVDDVIFTGRTVRAAMEAVSAIGRPAEIQLAVLIDRGHRELPIRADYVGKNVPTSKNEIVSVKVDEYDGETCVNLYSKDV